MQVTRVYQTTTLFEVCVRLHPCIRKYFSVVFNNFVTHFSQVNTSPDDLGQFSTVLLVPSYLCERKGKLWTTS